LNPALTSEPNRILVLDANQRSALAAVRSLGKLPGAEVHAADSTASALAGVSRYCSRYSRYPSPCDDTVAFGQWLIEHIRVHKIGFLLPMTEVSSRTALSLRPNLGNCVLPFADLDTVLRLSDKWRLIELAQNLGIACPASQLVAPGEGLAALAPEQFPLVVKPCLSRILDGNRWVSTGVHVARTPRALADLLASKSYLRDHPFMLQEFIPGHGAGIFALYRQGSAVVFFAHRRLREKPPAGGVSVLSESITADPQLLSLSRRLLDAVKWHGAAMIEFRIDPDGKPYLMEVNTRFWGSLQLAIDAGVDFPRLLLQASTAPVSPAPGTDNYRTGRRLRWLLGDCDNLYLTLRSKNYTVKQKLDSALRFFTPSPRNTRHEVNRWNDLKPALFELRTYLGDLL
jgi:predicted ATP-grasp superfamily ATP-dependent carboligase